jgi:hypothetical protein
VLTYAKTSDANRLITIIHFSLSVASPVASVVSQLHTHSLMVVTQSES